GLAVALAAAIWMGYRRWRPGVPAEAKPFLRIAGVPLVLTAAVWPISEVFDFALFGPPRYYISLLPAAVLATACLVGRLPRPGWWHGALLVVAGASTVVSLTTKTEPFRDNMEYLAKHRTAGEPIVVVPFE